MICWYLLHVISTGWYLVTQIYSDLLISSTGYYGHQQNWHPGLGFITSRQNRQKNRVPSPEWGGIVSIWLCLTRTLLWIFLLIIFFLHKTTFWYEKYAWFWIWIFTCVMYSTVCRVIFCLLLLSPFFTCKWCHSIFYLPRHSCV